MESLIKNKQKTMDGVAERRQQRKYLEAKRRVKSGAYIGKRKVQEGKFSQLKSSNSKQFHFQIS